MIDEIERYRKKIDEIDDLILKALTDRVRVCMAIGLAKKKRGIQVKDAVREMEVYKRVKEKSIELGLNAQQVHAVYREIVNMCSAVQE